MTDTHVSTHDAATDDRNDDILIYFDGNLVHRDDAMVSVYDSGFMLAPVSGKDCAFTTTISLFWLNTLIAFSKPSFDLNSTLGRPAHN